MQVRYYVQRINATPLITLVEADFEEIRDHFAPRGYTVTRAATGTWEFIGTGQSSGQTFQDGDQVHQTAWWGSSSPQAPGDMGQEVSGPVMNYVLEEPTS